MSHLRLVPSPRAAEANSTPEATGGTPVPTSSRRVPVRLLLALGGRCSCDGCCARYADHPALGALSRVPVARRATR